LFTVLQIHDSFIYRKHYYIFRANSGQRATYKCIIAEAKGADAPNEWGHYDGKGIVEVIYHDYRPPAGYNENKNNPWGAGRVSRITIVGKHYTAK